MTVSMQDGKMVMLYEIKQGVATSSFGIDVARLVGFPERVTQVLSSLEKTNGILGSSKEFENIDCACTVDQFSRGTITNADRTVIASFQRFIIYLCLTCFSSGE